MNARILGHHRQFPHVSCAQADGDDAWETLEQMLAEHARAGREVEEIQVGLLRRFRISDAHGWLATVWVATHPDDHETATPTTRDYQ